MKNLLLRNPVMEWSEVRVSIEKDDGSRYPFRAMPEDGQPKRLYGYAAKFESWTPFYNEIIERGAFQKSLMESDQLALVNHDRTLVLGRVGAGTLTLREDSIGLAFQLTVPNTTYGNDIWESVQRGDTAGCSFGFVPIKTTTRKLPSGSVATVLQEVSLSEVSITAFPAYPTTEVQARGLGELIGFTDLEMDRLYDVIRAGHADKAEDAAIVMLAIQKLERMGKPQAETPDEHIQKASRYVVSNELKRIRLATAKA